MPLRLSSNMRKIAAVTFDLWDTLIQEYPGGSDKVAELRVERIGKILADRGKGHPREKIEAAYRSTGAFLEMTWSKRRDMTVQDQLLFMLSCIDDKLVGKLNPKDMQDIEKAYVESILEHPPRLLPHAKDALREVASSGYKIGLISNTGRTPGSVLRTVMKDMGILESFDSLTFSNETLVRKPSEGAFRITLERLGAAPKASVHVGDNSESDVGGAKRFGMRAIQVLGHGGVRADLADARVMTLDEVPDAIERL